MIRTAKGWAGAVPSSYEEEKEVLRGILSGDEYTAYASNGGEEGRNLLFVWLERLLDWLEDLFPQLEMTGGSEDVLTYVIIGIGVVVLAALLLFLTQLLWVERRLKRSASMTGEEMERPPADLLELSRQAADEGDVREATRLLFLSSLLALQEREEIAIRSWKTNWEYAEELSEAGSPWLEAFRESALRFDTVWYGLRSISQEEFSAWHERLELAITGGKGEAA
ncbi:DUF4129 domain-containing protein [Paenibacillus alkalitolerans]|uniref:DUF4129 domain-containing protein n=1 Tax=Paenibacillus alkalitolerans TaxID=2799335 RepID=UPI0018F7178E|nr:DUF4129 domain-containing protein [Paenibacillus alkalitolerans]